ncbi:MAG: septum formation initiator family protein [Lachnospiraceae bacterium]|nr:septum formation initiator family protein [Lachnospiraceae bacterium]
MNKNEEQFEERMAEARIEREAKAQKARRERRQRRASVIALAVVALFLIVGMGIYIRSLKQKEAGYLARESELAAELQQEERIAEQLDLETRLRQTLKYIEQVAREKLGLVFPGDVIVKPGE